MSLYCLSPAHGGWLTVLHCHSFCPQRLYTVLYFLCGRAPVTSTMSRKQSRCSVFRCKTEHKSFHFLPTSEPLRTTLSLSLWLVRSPVYQTKSIIWFCSTNYAKVDRGSMYVLIMFFYFDVRIRYLCYDAYIYMCVYVCMYVCVYIYIWLVRKSGKNYVVYLYLFFS